MTEILTAVGFNSLIEVEFEWDAIFLLSINMNIGIQMIDEAVIA